MLTITVDDIWAYLSGNASAFGPIDAVTSWLCPGRWFSKAYKNGTWDGRKRLREFDRSAKKYRLPAGAVEIAIEALDAANIAYEVIDNRLLDVPDPVTKLADGKVLRPYQENDMLLPALAKGRGVIKACTGAGKTALAAAIIASYKEPTLWLTDRTVLMYQTQRAISGMLGKPVGLLGDGHDAVLEGGVTVAMVQTLVTRKDFLHPYLQKLRLLIMDEAHHAQADSWFNVIQSIPAPYRFGVSASPCFGEEGLRLMGVTGNYVCNIGAKRLIDEGWLMAPECYIYTVDAPALDKKLDYRKVYRDGITENAAFTDAVKDVAWTFFVEGRRTLTLTKEVKHGKALTHAMKKMGMKAEFLHGGLEQQEREDLIAALVDQKLDNLVAQAQIMGEGVDLPALDCLINATGTRGGGSSLSKSEADVGRVTVQAIGRLLRKNPGKERATYVDFHTGCHKFLTAASKERKQALIDEGFGEYIKDWTQYERL